MPNLNNYITDTVTGKIYRETDIAQIVAVDPTQWDENIANLEAQVAQLQAQIDDINNNQIPQQREIKADFFAQFPDKLPV